MADPGRGNSRWLEAPVRAVPTLNRGAPMLELPRLFVVHYTAGRSAANTLRRFKDPASRVSAHFVIAEDGTITQMVGLERKAWHAGESRIALPDGTLLRNLNDHSIGIELDYDGWLTSLSEGRRPRTPQQAVNVQGKIWPLYDQRQIDALIRTIDTIRARPEGSGQWVASPCHLTGHEDIAPGRKRDPGPAFPWAEVCERTQLTRLRPAE